MNRTGAAYEKDALAPVPPMGWNSWDCYAAAVNEAQLLENARFQARHLLAYGWEYCVCDIQWADPLAGTGRGHYIPFTRLCMDEYSRLLPAPERFPSAANGAGFKPIADQIHALGLKFGLHIMRGIPREAAHGRCAVLGRGKTADAIANPYSICGWNSDMYGLLPEEPGAQDYYDSLFQLYAAWGVDLIKADDSCNTSLYPHAPYSARSEVEMIRRAMDRCGRPMALSLSPGPAILAEGWHLAKHANMWRLTDDFWDDWSLLKDMFRRCEQWQAYVGPGRWPDCDMLPLGRIGAGFHQPRQTRLSREEQRTMMNLWCIFRSPLMMGGELPGLDEWTLGLLTNPEVLAVNQQGEAPTQWHRDENSAIWTSSAPNGGVYLALFNLSDWQSTQRVDAASLGFSPERCRDLWTGRDLPCCGDVIQRELAPHASALLSLYPR